MSRTNECSRQGVSVIICCHNSSARLPETLAHLSRQKVDPGVPWEVLIVDNASTDDTAQRARQLWPESAPAPLRIISEPRTGLSYARLRGLAEARYEFLGFIDDDNWMAEDWVQIAWSEMLAHRDVAALGSSSSPAFGAPPPLWFHQVEVMYAITPKSWKTGDFTQRPGTVWGAGMIVRKSAWLALRELDSPHLMSGRLRNSLAGGEDNELCYQLRLAGWKLWYEPRLHFQHFLPEGRLKWDYVRRLFYGGGEASAMLHPYRFSLDRMDAAQATRSSSGWFWALCMAVKDLLHHPLVPLRALLRPKEGNFAVLGFAASCGRITMLFKLRSVYKSNFVQVQKFAERVRGQAEQLRQAENTAGAAPELSAR
jgi:glycosyltransferase involved in cell wall biosynthesis